VTAGNQDSAVDRRRIQGTGELIAAITGGRVIRNINDLSEGLRDAAADLRGTYSVGFYAVTAPDNQWHRLRVRVSRRGVTVRHRQGYLAASTAVDHTQEWPHAQWNDIAYRPLISTAVQFDVRATFAGSVLKVALDVESDDLHFLTLPGQRYFRMQIRQLENLDCARHSDGQKATIGGNRNTRAAGQRLDIGVTEALGISPFPATQLLGKLV